MLYDKYCLVRKRERKREKTQKTTGFMTQHWNINLANLKERKAKENKSKQKPYTHKAFMYQVSHITQEPCYVDESQSIH